MKFVAITLLLLTSIFLIACSANQASNKISNSELENLASKYGGVYIFNQKFVKEIEKREAERKELRKNTKGKDLGGGLYAVNTKVVDEKYPQILSNGKKYYENSTDYENQTGKKLKIPVDKDDNIEVIDMTVDYYVTKTDYGLYGDEGMGFSFKKNRYVNISGDNKFILINGKFVKAEK